MIRYGGVLRISSQAMASIFQTTADIREFRLDFAYEVFDVYVTSPCREDAGDFYRLPFLGGAVDLPKVPECARLPDVLDAPIVSMSPWRTKRVFVESEDGGYDEIGTVDAFGRIVPKVDEELVISTEEVLGT